MPNDKQTICTLMRLSSLSRGEAPTGGVTLPFTDTPPGGAGFTGVVTSTVVVVTGALVPAVTSDVSCLATDLELNVQVENKRHLVTTAVQA